MVGDARLSSQLTVLPGPGISFRPVLVANEQAFRDFLALHREGMEDVYNIALQFTDAAAVPAGLASAINSVDSPLSLLRNALLAAGAHIPLSLLRGDANPVKTQPLHLFQLCCLPLQLPRRHVQLLLHAGGLVRAVCLLLRQQRAPLLPALPSPRPLSRHLQHPQQQKR